MSKEIDKLEILTEVCKEYDVSFSSAESNAIIAAMDRWQEVVNKNALLPDVSSIADLKVGDKIDIGGFITELKEIKYDPYVRINLYWFYNEKGEYKYNVRECITKV